MIIKLALLVLSLFYNVMLFCGFSAQTLIKTGTRYVPIERLSVGDMVACYDSSEKYAEKRVTHKKHIQPKAV